MDCTQGKTRMQGEGREGGRGGLFLTQVDGSGFRAAFDIEASAVEEVGVTTQADAVAGRHGAAAKKFQHLRVSSVEKKKR